VRQIPVELQTELLEEVTQQQCLITITTKIHTYRWTDGQNEVYWDGNWWIPKGIEFDPIGSTVTGQLDSMTLEIDNADQKFSDLVLSEDIRGSQCLIETVLLDINQAIIGEPAIIFQGFLDRMPMDGVKARVEVFSHMVRWKLMTPRRQHTPSCPWIFKGLECGYVGEVYRSPISDLLAEFTRSHLGSNYLNIDDRLGDLCIGGVFTASSIYAAGNNADKAFDRNIATYWLTATGTDPSWLRMQFAVAKIINKYKITQWGINWSPFDFIFQGSQDAATWVDLDVRNGATWGAETFKSFDFTNATAYLYYQLKITKSNPSYASGIRELELFGPASQVNDLDYNYTTAIGTYTSQYPTQSDTYVKATTKYDTNTWPYYTTDPAKSLTGDWTGNQWLSQNTVVANQRFHIDLGSAKIIKRIYYENGHYIGTVTNCGAKNFTLWGSNDAADFADLVYANDGTWVPLTIAQSTFDQHTGSDVADPKYIVVTNAVAYRYYAFKFADNWGYASQMGVRRIELQTALTTPAAGDVFGVSSIVMAPAATGMVVTLRVRAKQVTASGRTLAGAIKYNGTYYYSDPITPSTTITDYDFVWALNPVTGLAWTVAGIALIQGCGYATYYDPGAHEVDVMKCYLKVSNTVAGVSCNLSEDRCFELNNQDNFGGFSFISELQTKEYWWGTKQRIWGGGI